MRYPLGQVVSPGQSGTFHPDGQQAAEEMAGVVVRQGVAALGYARERGVGEEHAIMVSRPRRSPCSRCRCTHVLLTASMLVRRADAVVVIGAALLAKAAGSVSERELLSAVFEGRAKLADAVAQHMSPPLPLIGAGELVSTAAKTLRDCDAVMVVEEGKPVGVLTRHDLLGFLSDGSIRR